MDVGRKRLGTFRCFADWRSNWLHVFMYREEEWKERTDHSSSFFQFGHQFLHIIVFLRSRPVVRQWTQWLHICYMCIVYTYIILCCTVYMCTRKRKNLLGFTSNQYFDCVMRFITFKQTLTRVGYIHFWEGVILLITVACFLDDTMWRQLSKLWPKMLYTYTFVVVL